MLVETLPFLSLGLRDLIEAVGSLVEVELEDGLLDLVGKVLNLFGEGIPDLDGDILLLLKWIGEVKENLEVEGGFNSLLVVLFGLETITEFGWMNGFDEDVI